MEPGASLYSKRRARASADSAAGEWGLGRAGVQPRGKRKIRWVTSRSRLSRRERAEGTDVQTRGQRRHGGLAS
jgi:hypothetical protein